MVEVTGRQADSSSATSQGSAKPLALVNKMRSWDADGEAVWKSDLRLMDRSPCDKVGVDATDLSTK